MAKKAKGIGFLLQQEREDEEEKKPIVSTVEQWSGKEPVAPPRPGAIGAAYGAKPKPKPSAPVVQGPKPQPVQAPASSSPFYRPPAQQGPRPRPEPVAGPSQPVYQEPAQPVFEVGHWGEEVDTGTPQVTAGSQYRPPTVTSPTTPLAAIQFPNMAGAAEQVSWWQQQEDEHNRPLGFLARPRREQDQIAGMTFGVQPSGVDIVDRLLGAIDVQGASQRWRNYVNLVNTNTNNVVYDPLNRLTGGDGIGGRRGAFSEWVEAHPFQGFAAATNEQRTRDYTQPGEETFEKVQDWREVGEGLQRQTFDLSIPGFGKYTLPNPAAWAMGKGIEITNSPFVQENLLLGASNLTTTASEGGVALAATPFSVLAAMDQGAKAWEKENAGQSIGSILTAAGSALNQGWNPIYADAQRLGNVQRARSVYDQLWRRESEVDSTGMPTGNIAQPLGAESREQKNIFNWLVETMTGVQLPEDTVLDPRNMRTFNATAWTIAEAKQNMDDYQQVENKIIQATRTNPELGIVRQMVYDGPERQAEAFEQAASQQEQIDRLHEAYSQAYAAGDADLAAMYYAAAEELSEKSTVDIIEEHRNPWGQAVAGLLLDVGPLGAGGDVVGGGINALHWGWRGWQANRIYNIGEAAADANIARNAQPVAKLLQAMGMSPKDAQKAYEATVVPYMSIGDRIANRTPVLRGITGLTTTSKAEGDVYHLMQGFHGLLKDGVETKQDVGRILQQLVTDRSVLYKEGLSGLTSRRIVETTGGYNKWGAGVVGNNPFTRRFGIVQAAESALLNMESLKGGGLLDGEAFAQELTGILYDTALQLNGGKITKLPYGASNVTVRPLRNGMATYAYVDKKGTVLAQGDAMSMAEAMRFVDNAKAQVGKGPSVGQAVKSALMFPSNMQKRLMSDMFLTLRPRNSIRNAVSATAMMLANDAYGAVSRRDVESFWMRKLGTPNPFEGPQNELMGAMRHSGGIISPVAEGVSKVLTGKKDNVVSGFLKRMSGMSYDYTTLGGKHVSNIPVGEKALAGNIQYKFANEKITGDWSRQANNYRQQFLQIGLDPDTSYQLAKKIQEQGIQNGALDVMQVLTDFARNGNYKPGLKQLGLNDDVLLHETWSEIDNALKTLGPGQEQEAIARVAAALERQEDIVATRLAQTGIEPTTPRWMSKDVPNLATKYAQLQASAAKRAGAGRRAAKGIERQTFDQFLSAQADAFDTMREALRKGNGTPTTWNLATDYHKEYSELIDATRTQTDELAAEAMATNTKEGWAKFYRESDELQKKSNDAVRALSQKYAPLVEQVSKGQPYTPKYPGGWGQSLERYAAYDHEQWKRLQGYKIAGLGDPNFAPKLASWRGHVDNAVAELAESFRMFPTMDAWSVVQKTFEELDFVGDQAKQAARTAKDGMAMGAVKAQYYDVVNPIWEEAFATQANLARVTAQAIIADAVIKGTSPTLDFADNGRTLRLLRPKNNQEWLAIDTKTGKSVVVRDPAHPAAGQPVLPQAIVDEWANIQNGKPQAIQRATQQAINNAAASTPAPIAPPPQVGRYATQGVPAAIREEFDKIGRIELPDIFDTPTRRPASVTPGTPAYDLRKVNRAGKSGRKWAEMYMPLDDPTLPRSTMPDPVRPGKTANVRPTTASRAGGRELPPTLAPVARVTPSPNVGTSPVAQPRVRAYDSPTAQTQAPITGEAAPRGVGGATGVPSGTTPPTSIVSPGREAAERVKALEARKLTGPDYDAPNEWEQAIASGRVSPDVQDQYMLHGTTPDGLLKLLDEGIEEGRVLHSGPSVKGIYGVDTTRTDAPFLVIQRGDGVTTVEDVVVNDYAAGTIEQWRAAYPHINFMTVDEAIDWMSKAKAAPPRPPALTPQPAGRYSTATPYQREKYLTPKKGIINPENAAPPRKSGYDPDAATLPQKQGYGLEPAPVTPTFDDVPTNATPLPPQPSVAPVVRSADEVYDEIVTKTAGKDVMDILQTRFYDPKTGKERLTVGILRDAGHSEEQISAWRAADNRGAVLDVLEQILTETPETFDDLTMSAGFIPLPAEWMEWIGDLPANGVKMVEDMLKGWAHSKNVAGWEHFDVGELALHEITSIRRLKEVLSDPNVMADLLRPRPSTITPQQAQAILDMIPKVKADYDNMLQAAVAYAKNGSDHIMLNFSAQRGFDEMMNFFAPFSFFRTRMPGRAVLQGLKKPSLLGFHHDVNQAIDRENQQSGIPDRLAGTVPIPGTDWRFGLRPFTRDIFAGAMYVAADAFLRPEDVQEPGSALATLLQQTTGLGPLQALAVDYLTDGDVDEMMTLGSFLPFYRMGKYAWHMANGGVEEQGIWMGGTPYDAGVAGREVNNALGAGIVTEDYAKIPIMEDALGVPRTNDARYNISPEAQALYQSSTEQAAWEKWWNSVMGYLISPVYQYDEREAQNREMYETRQQLGYDVNPAGSREAVRQYDEATGHEGANYMSYVGMYDYNNATVMDMVERAENTDLSARKREINERSRQAMDEYILAHPDMTETEYYDAKDTFDAEREAALAEAEAALPNAANYAYPPSEDPFRKYNPAELDMEAWEAATAQARADLEEQGIVVPPDPGDYVSGDAGEDYRLGQQAVSDYWEQVNAEAEAYVNDPAWVEEALRGRDPNAPMRVPPGVAPALPPQFFTPGGRIMEREELPQTAEEYSEYSKSRFATPTVLETLQRFKADKEEKAARVDAVFPGLSAVMEQYSDTALNKDRDALLAQHPELKAGWILRENPEEYAEAEALFGEGAMVAYANIPASDGVKGSESSAARAEYYRQHPEAFLTKSWVEGRPNIIPFAERGDERDFGDDFEEAERIFGPDIWDAVIAYKQLRPYVPGGDNSHFGAFHDRYPNYEEWEEWWYEGPDGESGDTSNKPGAEGYVKGKYNGYTKGGGYKRRSTTYRRSSYRPSYRRTGSRSYSKYRSGSRGYSSRRYSSRSNRTSYRTRSYYGGGGGRYYGGGGGGGGWASFPSYGGGGVDAQVNAVRSNLPELAKAKDNNRSTLGSWRRWLDLD